MRTWRPCHDSRPAIAAPPRTRPMTETPHLAHPRYRADIDGLRALAVLAVVAYHAFPAWATGGFIGVDIFFVISGYLISIIVFENLERGTFRFTEFYIRRIKRIFPALFLVLAACLAYGGFALLPDEFRQLGKHVAGGTGFVANFVLWGEAGYFDNAAQTKPLMHLWSLGIEEQFYLAWPFLLWLGGKDRHYFLGIALAVAAASFGLNLAGIGSDPVATFYAPQTRCWELMVGSLLAWATLYGRIQGGTADAIAGCLRSNLLSTAGLLLLATGFWRIDASQNYPGLWALIPTAGAACVIGAGPGAWINRVLLSNRVAVWVGLISFPLYLWHWPLLSFARIVAGEAPDLALRVAAVVLAIALAALTYALIERPIRFGAPRWQKPLALTLAMVAVGALGLTIHATDLIRPSLPNIASASAKLAAWDQKLRQHPDYIEEQRKERRRTLRSPYCHFNKPGQTFEEYRQGMGECLKIAPAKPNVLIIGDSHAGDLYAALAQTHPELNLLQATGAGCTPIRSSYQPPDADCRKLINYGIEFGTANRIDTVVLAAHWPDDFAAIRSEIDELKGYVRNIVLVGPPAEFSEDVNKFIARRGADDDLASLTQKYLKHDTLALNQRMAEFAKANGVRYLDRLSLFCNARSVCDLLSDDGDIYIWDYGHLLPAGSRHLGNKLRQQQFFVR